MSKKILKLFATCKTADEFYAEIPRDLEGNIKFRRLLHATLAEHKGLIPGFRAWCTENKKIVFDTCLFTYNPRKKPGFQNRPFILRPKQQDMVDRLCHSIDYSHDIIVDKSREEGATEVICKLFTIYFLLHDQVYFLVGSRKEDLVDKSVMVKHGRVIGPHQTLFHKIMYAIAHLPVWWSVNFVKSHCFLQNLDNGAMIEGEATNDSFGAGNRATAVLVDEMARIEPKTAQYISDNIRDTTDVAIFNSTHFLWGSGHPYSKLLKSNKIERFVLGWEHNPEKNVGLYQSPAVDIIKIFDIDYYRKQSPVFDKIEAGEMFNWSQLRAENPELDDAVRFVADGGVSNFGCKRSLWFDGETVDRSRSKTDIAQNILRIPQGAAEQFFSPDVLSTYENKFAHEATFQGRFLPTMDNGIISGGGLQRHEDGNLLLYSELRHDRDGKLIMNPRHNYIVACDISRGTGASNSVAVIVDVNDRKVVGVWCDGYTDVVDFAELAVGLCKWLGGAFLIWEANGPGDTFGKRVDKQNYHNYYWYKDERTVGAKESKKPGWYNTPGVNGTKISVLTDLDAGLNEALKTERLNHYIEIPDEYVLSEMCNYIFAAGRADVIASDEVASSSEGKFAHGDRVMGVALAFFALKYQPPKNFQEKRTPPQESFERRYQKWLRAKKAKERGQRKYRYN